MDLSKIFTDADNEHVIESSRLVFRIVVLYDNHHSAARAISVLEGLLHRFLSEFEFFCDLFQLASAIDGECRLPLMNPEQLGLIIVADSCKSQLPAAVENWLMSSIRGRRSSSIALMALLESHPACRRVENQTSEFLEGLAAQAHVHFFLHELIFSED